MAENTILAFKLFDLRVSRLKGQINGLPFDSASAPNNWKAFRLTLSNFSLRNVLKNAQITYKTCKIKIVVKIFWRRIGTSPLVETC